MTDDLFTTEVDNGAGKPILYSYKTALGDLRVVHLNPVSLDQMRSQKLTYVYWESVLGPRYDVDVVVPSYEDSETFPVRATVGDPLVSEAAFLYARRDFPTLDLLVLEHGRDVPDAAMPLLINEEFVLKYSVLCFDRKTGQLFFGRYYREDTVVDTEYSMILSRWEAQRLRVPKFLRSRIPNSWDFSITPFTLMERIIGEVGNRDCREAVSLILDFEGESYEIREEEHRRISNWKYTEGD